MIVRNFLGGGTGGEQATIFVTGLTQTDSVYATSPSGKRIDGVWGTYTVEGASVSCFAIACKEYGTYTLTASNGKTQEWLVDAATDFVVDMYPEGLRLYWDGTKYENWAVRPSQITITEFNELADHFEVISLRPSGSYYGYAQIWTPDLLDFTGYSTIKILAKASYSSYFGLGDGNGDWVNGYNSFPSSGDYVEYSQDISNVAGENQSIVIGTQSRTSPVTLYIKRVWLE